MPDMLKKGVGVAVGVGQAELMRSEKARIEPMSPLALSMAVSVQVPFGFCPSNADNGLFGVNEVPLGNANVPSPF